MVAGTIAMAGTPGTAPGFAMRRGTVGGGSGALSTFADCGEHSLSFLTLLLRSWRTLPGRLGPGPTAGVRVRYLGDRANGGLGGRVV